MEVPYCMDGHALMKKVRDKKLKEGKTVRGKFICGLDGCEDEVSSAHQSKHAEEQHGMTVMEYKEARIAMKQGKYSEPGNINEGLAKINIPPLMPIEKVPSGISSLADIPEVPEKEALSGACLLESTCKIPETTSKVESTNKDIPKEIIEIKAFVCPHCGGKLKLKE